MTTDFHLGGNANAAVSPLAHVHLLITRPVMPASRTAQRVAALGATPYVFPAILIEPPPNPASLKEAVANLSRYQAAIFVSPSAAEMTIIALVERVRAWPRYRRRTTCSRRCGCHSANDYL
jgi:uroporphyrinogen-III synthase